MNVIINDTDALDIPWADDVTGGRYFVARDTARERVDLLRLIERYAGRSLTEVDGGTGYKTACFFPSRMPGFSGTCAEQDASAGSPGESLSITRSEDGTHWRWRCFSCERGQSRDGTRPGDVVDLVTHAEGFNVNAGNTGSLKALRHVLQLVGLDHVMDGRPGPRDNAPPPDLDLVIDASEKTSRRAVKVSPSLALRLNQIASYHWQGALRSSDAANARTYLAARGVTDEQIERYAIGYARARFADLVPQLGPQNGEVARAMNLARSTSTGKTGDAFTDRVMFPYCYPDRDGGARPIGVYGFAGRNLTGVDPHTGKDIEGFVYPYGKPSKWSNSKNVDGVYNKGADLVGVYQALERARDLDRCAPVEGNFDMLALDRIEAPAVSMVGAAMTLAHVLLIRDVLGVSQITYAIDADASGYASVPRFAAHGVLAGYPIDSLTILACDPGLDPDEMPSDVLRERWLSPVPVVDFLQDLATHSLIEREKLRALFDAAPQLASHFGEAAPVRQRVFVADAYVVECLQASPHLAAHLAAEDAERLLGKCPAWRHVRDLAFADASPADLSPLPQDMRRAWLRLLVADLQARAEQHAKTPEPSDLADLRAWLRNGYSLREREQRARDQLHAVNALYR